MKLLNGYRKFAEAGRFFGGQDDWCLVDQGGWMSLSRGEASPISPEVDRYSA